MFFNKWIILILVVLVYFWWSKRQPGNNGLGFSTTADEAISENANLEGKNIIVTGGYSGIGLITVETLAKYKTSIWIPARPESMHTCQSFIDSVKRKTGNNNLYCNEMDLSKLSSVAEFAKEWKKLDIPLHILINNAGIMACPYAESADGFELQFATNHLGHFLLTNLLMENLRAGKPSRVVSVSSIGHGFSAVRFDDLTGKGTWYTGNGTFTGIAGPWIAYGQSKSANILFAVELDKRMRGFGSAYSLHPGSIVTNLQRYADEIALFQYITPIIRIFTIKTPSQGAATQLYVATAPELEDRGGGYYDDCNEKLPSWHAMDPIQAQQLWSVSEGATAKYLQ